MVVVIAIQSNLRHHSAFSVLRRIGGIKGEHSADKLPIGGCGAEIEVYVFSVI